MANAIIGPNELDAAQRSEAEFRRLIDRIPTLAWSCREDGSADFLNERWLEFTGLSLEQALGWEWTVALHPEDSETMLAVWARLVASGEEGELEARLRRFDGQYRWFLFRAVSGRDEEGKVVRWYGTNTDIENARRAEEQLRKSEAELRKIVDLVPGMIVVLDAQGTPLYGNRVALDFFQVTSAELRFVGFGGRFSHPDDVEKLGTAREQALARGEPFELELRILTEDNAYRWFLFRYNASRDEFGQVLRWYVSATDIHDRKQAEETIQNENLVLREEIDRTSMFGEIVGSSIALRKALKHVTRVARTDSTVLILGETGTGKELIARAIHRQSQRADRAFVRVNCGAIPPALVSSELFGCEKGAFTGAVQRRIGRFEAAHGGTILLDEVGELPSETQIALLRVLQEREFERVGSSQPIAVDVRVLAATNRDLKAAVAAGTFREDLFYRLNVFPIQMPSLRERMDDIPILVEYLVQRYAKRACKKIRNIDGKTLEMLQAYPWPGNIRELQNVIERAVILSDGDTFFADETWFRHEIPCGRRVAIPHDGSLRRLDNKQEKQAIESALASSAGRISGPTGAAVKLGIPRQTLESKIMRLGINKHRSTSS